MKEGLGTQPDGERRPGSEGPGSLGEGEAPLGEASWEAGHSGSEDNWFLGGAPPGWRRSWCGRGPLQWIPAERSWMMHAHRR